MALPLKPPLQPQLAAGRLDHHVVGIVPEGMACPASGRGTTSAEGYLTAQRLAAVANLTTGRRLATALAKPVAPGLVPGLLPGLIVVAVVAIATMPAAHPLRPNRRDQGSWRGSA